ncbi:hypothetical protein ACFXPA_01110 [Amycolatopsis sp. NPDC059090]|uniref:hypothetical protein n=1 Tax=unclassified Amycolatopsis TaxID=2618356 RepID=UPI0036714BBA
MNRLRNGILAVLFSGSLIVLAAFGSSPPAEAPPGPAPANLVSQVSFANGTAKSGNAAAGTGDFATGPGDAATKWVQMSVGAVGPLNPVVVNAAGFTLYRSDKDTARPSVSNCSGDCAATWPPVLVRPGSRIFLDGVAKSDVGVIERADGGLQVTISGWPVYRFSKDTRPGQARGQGVGGTWFGVTPSGTKAGNSPQGTDSGTGLDYRNGTARQNNAPPNTGDNYLGPRTDPPAMKWVQLTAGSASGLNPIVHDGAGFTLYRFDKDTTHPPVSHCSDACAATWPPVLVQTGSRIFVDGVPTSVIGIVTRADGRHQVTIGGWPVYRFSKDTAAGQTNGEGVGSTWFAVSPTGGKIAPTENAAPPAAAPSSAPAVPPALGTRQRHCRQAARTFPSRTAPKASRGRAAGTSGGRTSHLHCS